jgi:CRISPR-associated protein Csm5
MEAEMTVFRVKLTTLTPIHIGDGDELRQDFDFSVFKGRTYRLDENAILDSKNIQSTNGKYPLPGQALQENDYNKPEYFRYILPGSPRSKKVDARVKSFIKDVHDRPYIPGSSIKGAVRTALAWTGFKEIKIQLDRGAIGRNKSWAGQNLEHKLFGPDPNHDLLRSLHVSDFFGPQKPGDGLILLNAQVLTLKSAGSPVELESVKGDISFEGSLTIDQTLFGEFAERELHFKNRKHWLDELVARTRFHSLERIKLLADWYARADSCEGIARFYNQLGNANLADNQTVMQIGWGSGWDGKTFWTHLQSDSRLFEQIVSDFRMHKAAPGSPPRKPGDPFPRSKRAAMTVKDGIAKPAAPLGWVLMEIMPK